MGRSAEKFQLRSGSVLSGRIRIDRVVGQGSMGIVLEALDLRDNSTVAVKLMSPERANNADARKRFLREARAAVRVQSENVTRMIDVGELEDGTPYLVMEFLVGSTLEEMLLREGPLPIDIAIEWTLQALRGVGEAHRQGLVHRDLKPENLFLAERPGQSPIVKVLDFGTVKDLVAKGTKLTRTGSTMGSPAYMPPEQVRAEAIDQRADVWAMGVTLYELITGRLPFDGDSVPQTLAAILRDPHVPLRARRPDAPPALEALIDKALSKDPLGRHASADELYAALTQVSASVPTTASVKNTIPIPSSSRSRIERPDPFADTTDMSAVAVADVIDASRVRPRVREDDPAATIPDAPEVIERRQRDAQTERRREYRRPLSDRLRFPLMIAAAVLVAGSLCGGAAYYRAVHRERAKVVAPPGPGVTGANAPAALPGAPGGGPLPASPNAITATASPHPSAQPQAVAVGIRPSTSRRPHR